MPAWMTSLLRELVSVPTPPCRSSSSVVEVDDDDEAAAPLRRASCRAMASPTTPPPMTWVLSVSHCQNYKGWGREIGAEAHHVCKVSPRCRRRAELKPLGAPRARRARPQGERSDGPSGKHHDVAS